MRVGRTRWTRWAAGGVAAALVVATVAAPAAATTPATTRISSDPTGAPAAGGGNNPVVSATGRYVVFESSATTLVAGDTNGRPDIFLRDRRTASTERISVNSAEVQGDGDSFGASAVTPDGRFVAFTSQATNLAAGDTNGTVDVFVRDRRAGTTRLVSVGLGGAPADGASFNPAIAANGRDIAFSTAAGNIVHGDTNGARDVFVRDVGSGVVRRVSVRRDGGQGNGDSDAQGISADGRYVGFVSTATNLASGASPESNAYVKDRRTGALVLASVSGSGAPFRAGGTELSISADGRQVAFNAAPDTGLTQTYVRDLDRRRTTLASFSVSGGDSSASSSHAAISASGRYVAFVSGAHDLVAGFQSYNGVFVVDRRTGAMFQGSLTTTGTAANSWVGIGGLADCGVAFTSNGTNVVPDAGAGTHHQVYFRSF